MNNTDRKLLRSCPLFAEMTDAQLEAALKELGAKEARYERGDYIKKIPQEMSFFGLVLSGSVQVCMNDMDGNTLIMAVVGPGETFGESLCYLQRNTPIYVFAATAARVLQLHTTHLGAELSARLTRMLAMRTLSMNNRIQILSKKTIRERVMTFFALQREETGDSAYAVFELSMNRADMAAYLGADASALSRELARMKKDGLIDYYKSTFKVFK